MNILVVRNDKLGDFITALPTMYVLKQHNPHNKIIACVAPLNKTLAESMPFIDEVIVDDTPSSFALSKKLRQAKIDASITLFSNTKVAFAQFLAGIKIRIAPATKIAQIFYTRRIKQRRSRVEMTEFEYNLQLSKVLFPKINLSFPSPLVLIDTEKKNKIFETFKKTYNITKEVIAFHPGFGGSSDANWNIYEYIELSQQVGKDYQVVFTFGPGEDDLYEIVKNASLEEVVLYKSQGSIMDFASLLSSFKLFISTSTGPYHLAAMVGIPTMTFFADSLFASVKRWKSISDEKLQMAYMISKDDVKREKLFTEVKKKIASI
ncbi:glycosyltransferase family 9 protein [Sulfurimonas sp. MAG313]|nr:glycosyltransferase family 9 protein [Sulfurimonas sp. MAG313]MDF1881095.1 glycosyltransferase family 9 protein [Sulfurimonas sp. MAG313]